MAQKTILMLAVDNHPEALRMAAGLTLLDDKIRVMALSPLTDTPDVAEQLEALSFCDVPVVVQGTLDGNAVQALALAIAGSDVVFTV